MKNKILFSFSYEKRRLFFDSLKSSLFPDIIGNKEADEKNVMLKTFKERRSLKRKVNNSITPDLNTQYKSRNEEDRKSFEKDLYYDPELDRANFDLYVKAAENDLQFDEKNKVIHIPKSKYIVDVNGNRVKSIPVADPRKVGISNATGKLVVQLSLENGGFEQYREDISNLALHVSTDNDKANESIADKASGNWEQFSAVKLSKMLDDPNITVENILKKFPDLEKNVAKDIIENKSNIFKGSIDSPFVSSKGREWVSIDGELFYNSNPKKDISFGKLGGKNYYIAPEGSKDFISVFPVDNYFSWGIKYLNKNTNIIYDSEGRPFESHTLESGLVVYHYKDSENEFFRYVQKENEAYESVDCDIQGKIIDKEK